MEKEKTSVIDSGNETWKVGLENVPDLAYGQMIMERNSIQRPRQGLADGQTNLVN